MAGYFENLMSNPMFNLGLNMMAGGFSNSSQPLADAMRGFQGWQQNQQLSQFNKLKMEELQRQQEKARKQEELSAQIPELLKQYQKPAIPGALEQGMLAPNLPVQSQQAQQLMEQEQGSPIADILTRINQSGNYANQGQEMPLVGQPASFDVQGFKQAALPIQAQLDPMGTMADILKQAEPKTPIKVGAEDVLLDPVTMKPVYEGPGKEQYKERINVVNIGGVPHYIKEYSDKGGKSGTWKPLSDPYPVRSTVANISQSQTMAVPKGDTKYAETRMEDRATAMAELDKSAQSAYRANQALERFKESAAKGTAGGAQPIISGVQNFLASFGYDSKDLTNVRVMEQAIGDILGSKMAELGARGLTDKDMEVLRQALPRINTDKNARVQVADILIKANTGVLNEWETQRQSEQEIYPELFTRIPEPSWYRDYKKGKQKTSPSGVKFLGFE